MNLNGNKYLGESIKHLQGAEMAMREHFVLPLTIVELARIRCSQLNGCYVCVDTHVGVARGNGETEERLLYLPVWRDAPASLYTEKEKAALEWAETLTLVNVKTEKKGIPQEVVEKVKEHFSPRELSELSISIATINMWNRQTVAFGKLQKYFP